jgi:sorting nexin-29
MEIFCSVIPLNKKGDQLECAYYWGITLLNVVYKVFSNILYTRLLPHIENKVGDYQANFRLGKSTINQIFIVQQILEKMKEFRICTHFFFIDFKSAYDSIDREWVYDDMNELNISEKLIRMVRITMSNTQSQVRLHSNLAVLFTTHKGVLQGDALECLLFNITLEYVIRRVGIQTRGTLFYRSVQHMAYVDDIVIISRSLSERGTSATGSGKQGGGISRQ